MNPEEEEEEDTSAGISPFITQCNMQEAGKKYSPSERPQ